MFSSLSEHAIACTVMIQYECAYFALWLVKYSNCSYSYFGYEHTPGHWASKFNHNNTFISRVIWVWTYSRTLNFQVQYHNIFSQWESHQFDDNYAWNHYFMFHFQYLSLNYQIITFYVKFLYKQTILNLQAVVIPNIILQKYLE